MKNKITKLFTLLIMAAMSMGVRAEGTVSIPQASAGTYIPIGTVPTAGDKVVATGVTLTGCQVDGNAKAEEYTSYTVGSTNGSPMSIEFALNATAGNYLFTFKSGHAQGTAEISIELRNSSSEVIWNNDGNNVQISQTGSSWTPIDAHTFLLGDLAAGTYTLTITGVSKSGSYYGNFGNFCFHTASTLAMPYDSDHELNVSMATVSGMKIHGTYLTEISENSYADNMYMYVPEAGYYKVYAGYGYATAGIDNFTITITDMASGINEVNAKNYTVADSKTYVMTDLISTGWKKIRLDHPGPTITASFRLEHMYFNQIASAALPMYGMSYLDLSAGTFGRTASAKYNHNPQYESANQNIGYNGDGGYAEYYIGNETTGYYEFHIGTSRSQESSFTVTITDEATDMVEVNQDFTVPSGSSYADLTCALYTKITSGLKKIRIETHSESNSYAFNYNHVCFRSIPELPMSGAGYLDLSAGIFGRTASAKYSSDPRYESANQNIGYNGDGGYAEYYVENKKEAHYIFHIATRRYQESSFTLTITDMATGTAEVSQLFDVDNNSGYADQACTLNSVITTGVKKIRIETTSESNSYAFNYNHVCFQILQYTRTHPHMNLNTLCYPYQIDSYTGATFYNILSTTVEGGNITELVLEEHVGALEAGVPYFYDPTPGEAELVCYYSGAEVSTPGTAAGGAFVGTYVDDAPVPSGSYVTVNNQLYKTGDGATMGEYRAYVRPQAYTRAALPGRKILRIGDKGTTTAVETLMPDASCSQKILRNGQVIIIRGDKKYNMLGQEL